MASGYCLRGKVGVQEQVFHLLPGDSSVGSLPSNVIVLDVPEVSRVHAMIHIGTHGVVVEDLESKNGTYVNGNRVENADLNPGDELGVGPVLLLLQETDAEDGELAITLDQSPFLDSSDNINETLSVAEQNDGWCCRCIPLLDEIIGPLLRQPHPAFSDALTSLLGQLKVGGGCLTEWDGAGDPVVLAIAGVSAERLFGAEVRAWFHQAATSRQIWTSLWLEDHSLSCLILSHGECPPVGLVLTTNIHHHFGNVAVLRNVLRVIAYRRDRLFVEGPSQTGSTGELAIPASFVVGQSEEMQALYRQMRSVVRSRTPLVLIGETGVGKELLARILHDSSEVASGPFIPVNCAAIPSDLLEAEMFGISEGVATGVSARQGKFQLADGGTLFLDEIGDMPANLQAKLLRVLEDGRVSQLGGRIIQVRTWVIAATNSNLLELVRKGTFRRDLYYRIAAFRLDVPPLRERAEDIPALIEHFLWMFTDELSKPVRGVTLAATRMLQAYRWPGNVRELRNEIGRLVHACPSGQVIGSGLISEHIRTEAAVTTAGGTATPAGLRLKPALARLEARLIREALAQTDGNRTRAAELLGISRNNLIHKIKSLRLDC
jgi:DNA-binding NtrC family response regulator